MFEPGSEIGPPCNSKATQSLTTNVGDRSGRSCNFYYWYNVIDLHVEQTQRPLILDLIHLIRIIKSNEPFLEIQAALEDLSCSEKFS